MRGIGQWASGPESWGANRNPTRQKEPYQFSKCIFIWSILIIIIIIIIIIITITDFRLKSKRRFLFFNITFLKKLAIFFSDLLVSYVIFKNLVWIHCKVSSA